MPPVGQRQERARSTAPRWAASPIGGIFSVGVEEPYRWKDSVQSEAEIRLWVADGVANGLRPWFTKFAGMLHDRRWLQASVEDLYRWHHGARAVPAQRGAAGARGLVYSQQTAWFYGGAEAQAEGRGPRAGLVPGAVEARIPFEMVHDRLLDAAHLAPFKTLILPNIAALSDAQCRQLRAFVERGGGLVATYETSLYDEWGVRRKDFGLADLFGVAFAGRVDGPMQNAYLRLEHDPAPAAAIRCSPASRTRRGSSTALRGSTSTAAAEFADRAADADPELSRPADGEGLPARAEDRRRRGVPARGRRAAASSISPGTSTAPSGRSWPSTTACCSRNAVRWATDEEPPVAVDGPRRARRDRLAAEGLDDRPPGQPDQPDDDEGPVPRADPGRRAAGDGPAARRARRPGGSSSWWRGARCPVAQDGPRLSVDGAVGPGPRGRGDRSLRSRPSGARRFRR